ncbi:MAG: WbqC family protein, partial [Ghiorsea sp.]|nr:WbqC family protein [Ghiorsea sp.]
SPYLDAYWQPIKMILQQKHDKLVDLNVALIRALGHMLGCTSPLYLASDLPVDIAEPTERLIQITQHLQGDVYLSGAEGRNYLQPSAFTDANIKLLFQQCTPPSYPQMHGDFIPYLSVLDVLLNIGEDAKALIANMGDMQP